MLIKTINDRTLAPSSGYYYRSPVSCVPITNIYVNFLLRQSIKTINTRTLAPSPGFYYRSQLSCVPIANLYIHYLISNQLKL